jgi:1,2-diacylglycerol 3-alpha-glucosyltransferase
MNILMISDVYFPRINGVSTSIRTFRRSLEQAGHRVTLIAPDYDNGADAEPGTIRIPSRHLPFDPEDRLMRYRVVLKHTESLRKEKFDLIHIHTPFVAHYAGVRLARALGIPCVETYHTFFEEYLFHYIPIFPRAWLRRLARFFSKSQCNQVERVVVPSTAMQQVLQDYGVSTTISIVPTGIDPERFSAGDGALFKRMHGIDASRLCLVYVGRVAHEKNIDFLFRALARIKDVLPDILLIVAGEGPAEWHLHHLSQTLELQRNVLFVGYLRNPDHLRACYCAGDAFVFASRTETQGLVLLEAMSLGVPVVSTAVMGTADILQSGRGSLVAEENVVDFANKALRVLLEPVLRSRLADEAREEARRWSAEEMGARLLALYRRLPQRRREDRKVNAAAKGSGV